MEKHGLAPAVVLLNKVDLESDWSISEAELEQLGTLFDAVYRTSAKTGQDVERALNFLSDLIIKRDLQCR
jgi:50S ribosomal subunit-associated GTPase HflX